MIIWTVAETFLVNECMVFGALASRRMTCVERAAPVLPPAIRHGLAVENRYSKWQGLRWRSYWLALVWLVLGFWLRSMLRKIFLTDVHKPKPPEAVAWKDSSEITGNFLIVGLAESGKSGSLRSIAGLSPKNCVDLSVELKRIISGGAYPDCAEMPSVVLLDHCEFNLNDREYNLVRLNLLEHLVYGSSCTILLMSSVDPLYFLTEGAPETLSDPKEPEIARKLLDRWILVLSKFKRVRGGTSKSREFSKQVSNFVRSHPDRREFAIWVKRECNGTSMLRSIGASILDDFDESDPLTRDWVTRNVLDRAEDYYRALWLGLTSSERLVLYQLALDGWANPKNTAALQQLESKFLIRKMPTYCIMNASFRLFIASTEHADEIAEWEKQQKQSTWRVFRLLIIALGIAVGIWFFHSQAALSQELAAYVAGLATLFTAVSALLGHSVRQTSAKPEPS